MVANDTRDRSAIVSFLARQMDARINKALAGEVSVTPVPTPTPVPILTAEETALQQGYDLSKMLPTLADLPGAKIKSDGFQDDPNVVASYQRVFDSAEGLVFDLASSKLISLDAPLDLQPTFADAKGLVLGLQQVDPAALAQAFGPSFARLAGVTPETITMNALTLSDIGDAVAGFGIRIETAQADIDGVILYFSRGLISVTLITFGPALLVVGDDVATIGQLIDERIQANSP